jgi:hypothetical protein
MGTLVLNAPDAFRRPPNHTPRRPNFEGRGRPFPRPGTLLPLLPRTPFTRAHARALAPLPHAASLPSTGAAFLAHALAGSAAAALRAAALESLHAEAHAVRQCMQRRWPAARGVAPLAHPPRPPRTPLPPKLYKED